MDKNLKKGILIGIGIIIGILVIRLILGTTIIIAGHINTNKIAAAVFVIAIIVIYIIIRKGKNRNK